MEAIGGVVEEALDALDAAVDAVTALPIDTLTPAQMVAVLARLERVAWRHPVTGQRIIARLHAEVSPVELGAKNTATALADALRISRAEARRRLADAHDLAPRRTLLGEELAPKRSAAAAAQADGRLGPEHLRIIGGFFKDLPDAIDATTCEQAETTLTRVGVEHTPEGLREAADRLLMLLHPDGDLPDDAERARKRGIHVGRQQPDGTSPINGHLTPEARATWDAVMANWAAPGMCNPDDEQPCTDGQPDDTLAQGDQRTPAQRHHDALLAMGRALLASGQLGQHNGLPATIIVTTTLQDLQSGAGHAVTAGGTLLPMPDLIRLASHSHHYLAVFDEHTSQALYLGRTKRLASPGQRIMLLAKHRGCTRPGCTAPGYWAQVHHAERDWADGGQTNIDELTLACGPDNRLVKPGGWTTRIRKDGRTEWIPPPHLDTGQARINDYHHPERMLTDPDPEPKEEDEEEPPDASSSRAG
jgi:hypothetical protein